MTADVIKFPKVKARPSLTAEDLMLAQACAAASADALIELASEYAAGRSPFKPIAAIAAVFSGDDD